MYTLTFYTTAVNCTRCVAIPSCVGAMSTSQRAVMPCDWGVKVGMVRVWVAGKTVWSPCYTRVISERFRDKELIYKALYKFAFCTFFTFFTLWNCKNRTAITIALPPRPTIHGAVYTSLAPPTPARPAYDCFAFYGEVFFKTCKIAGKIIKIITEESSLYLSQARWKMG